MNFILYTTLIALFYYLVLLFTTNKWILIKFKPPADAEGNSVSLTAQMMIALNINIICSLFLLHNPLMNYVTFLIGDDTGFLRFMSVGGIIVIMNIAALGLSFILSKIFYGFMGENTPFYLRPILWVAINLIFLKLTTLYYEAYIGTQSFTIL